MKTTLFRSTLILGVFLMAARALFALDTLPAAAPVPADNSMSPAKVELGKQLYFDARLSSTGKVSCNSCHAVDGKNPSGTDNLPVSVGIDGQKGGRNAPTVLNAAFQSVQFWDGRAPSLEEQAKGPIVNPIEMGMKDHDSCVERISKIEGYKKQFNDVFGDDSLNIKNVAKAIAAYERTLITPDSPYDRFMKGDKKAMTAAAQRGMGLVQTVGCTACHSGPNFSGPVLPEGNGFYQKFPTHTDNPYARKYQLMKDHGRFEHTKKDSDKHMWRVPTWRNVAITGPYFHNGSVKSLDEAIRLMAKVQLNRDLKPGEVSDIAAFLKALTGKLPKQVPPKLPPDPT